MNTSRGPRLEFAVGAFLLLALASVLVLAVASTNGKFGFARDTYELTARFTNLGQLRPTAPVKLGGNLPRRKLPALGQDFKNKAPPCGCVLFRRAVTFAAGFFRYFHAAPSLMRPNNGLSQ